MVMACRSSNQQSTNKELGASGQYGRRVMAVFLQACVTTKLGPHLIVAKVLLLPYLLQLEIARWRV